MGVAKDGISKSGGLSKVIKFPLNTIKKHQRKAMILALALGYGNSKLADYPEDMRIKSMLQNREQGEDHGRL